MSRKPTISESFGIKFGPPLSARKLSEIDRQHAEWMKDVLAYMETQGVDFDTAYVACGGTIIPLTAKPEEKSEMVEEAAAAPEQPADG